LRKGRLEMAADGQVVFNTRGKRFTSDGVASERASCPCASSPRMRAQTLAFDRETGVAKKKGGQNLSNSGGKVSMVPSPVIREKKET